MKRIELALGVMILAGCADGGGYDRTSALATTRVIDFDYDANGAEIAHDVAFDEQYAAWGVHSDAAFYTARRTLAYPDYDNTSTLNLLCTAMGNSNRPDVCRSPVGSFEALLVVDLDEPAEFASIEGRTRADCIYDADGLLIDAYDANGVLVGSGSSFNNNNPDPWCTEGLLVASVSAPGIRRLVINPVDTDSLDTLVIAFTDAEPTPTPTASPSPSPTATPSPTPTPVPACPVDVKITPSTINLNANGNNIGVRVCDICEGETLVETSLGIRTPAGTFIGIDLSAPHGQQGPSCYRFNVSRQTFSTVMFAELGWTPGGGGDTVVEIDVVGTTAPSNRPLDGSDLVRVINP